MPADNKQPSSPTRMMAKPKAKKLLPPPPPSAPSPPPSPPSEVGLLQAVEEGAGAPLTSEADPAPTPENLNSTFSDTASLPTESETSLETSSDDSPPAVVEAAPAQDDIPAAEVPASADKEAAGPPAKWFLRLTPPEGEDEHEDFDTQEELVTRLKELVLDKSSLVGVRVKVLRGWQLGLSPFPYPYLQDGEDLIPLFTMPNEIVISTDGYLIPQVLPQAATPAPAPAEEEEVEEEVADSEETTASEPSVIESTPEEEPEEGVLAGAIAGVIAGPPEGDNYGSEPPTSPG